MIVPVIVSAAVSATGDDQYQSANAQVSFTGPATFGIEACWTVTTSCSSSASFVDNVEDVPTDALEDVYAAASVNVAGLSVGSGYASEGASAIADPTVMIDPSFADVSDYTIVFSQGIGSSASVPEPSPLSVLIIAVAALGLLRWSGKARRTAGVGRDSWKAAPEEIGM